jgi:hypothetical protein
MTQTFRLRKAIKLQGMGFAALYLPIATAFGCLFFVQEPERYEFPDSHGAIIAGAMGVAVFGSMFILAIYSWAAYHAERLTIDGTKVWLRTLTHNRQFDVAELRSLKWKTSTHGGSIVFRLLGYAARLDLTGYEKADRLQIILALRRLVPSAVQVDWPLFCYKIALPLREGRVTARSCKPGERRCRITRQRYDRAFKILVPLATAIVLQVAAWFGLWQMLALPVALIFAWLLLRFHVPRKGYSDTHLASTSSGRLFMVTFAVIIAMQLMMLGLRLYGVEREAACSAGCAIIVPAFPMFLFALWRAERRRSMGERQAAQSAPDVWDAGEANNGVQDLPSMNGLTTVTPSQV